ncbi:MAG TPA: c-type cytochrome [Stellaceae bacterium]
MIWPNPIRAIFLFCVAAVALATPAYAQDPPSYLARAGDCTSCHTAPGGRPFAGGLRMNTPLGAIFTTNITPDKATGIGDYSFADFDRALRRGVAKDGHHLYPAMPYTSFAKLSDADMRGLYNYFMHSVKPVRQKNRRGEIPWPLDMRWPLAVWDWLFLDHAAFHPSATASAAVNRGAYLVETLAHCGACHTPRGIAWNERGDDASDPRFLSGEMLDFWAAPDLRGDVRTGLGAWSTDDIVRFLKSGHNEHGVVFGSMSLVTTNSTPYLRDADLAAIAAYLKAMPPRRADQHPYAHDDAMEQHLRAHRLVTPGGMLYLGQCARCHGADGRGDAAHAVPPLAGNPVVLGRDPTSAIHIVLDGGPPPAPGATAPNRMPPFRALLSDVQTASVISFIRAGWGNRAAPVTPAAIGAVRNGTRSPRDQVARGAALTAAHGCGACHSIPRVAGATGTVGPPLDNIADRAIIAGLLANNPDTMATWLRAPQRIKPGDAMPDLGLSQDEARDIAAFLATLHD